MVGSRNRMAGGEQEAKGGKDRGGGKGGGGRCSEEGDERVFGLRAVSILPATPTALQEPEPTQAVGDGNNTRGVQAREKGAKDGYDPSLLVVVGSLAVGALSPLGPLRIWGTALFRTHGHGQEPLGTPVQKRERVQETETKTQTNKCGSTANMHTYRVPRGRCALGGLGVGVVHEIDLWWVVGDLVYPYFMDQYGLASWIEIM